MTDQERIAGIKKITQEYVAALDEARQSFEEKVDAILLAAKHEQLATLRHSIQNES